MSEIRVRFAPSPTGPLHIGGVRTALYNYLFAKKNNGKFILRIEDTDQTRFVAGAEEYIKESLNWLGLNYDEGPGKEGDFAPYRQSERKDIYKKYADKLLNDGKAYIAFDAPEELDQKRKEFEEQKKTFKYDVFTREEMNNSLTLSADEVQSKIDNGKPYVVRIKIPKDETVKLTDIVRGTVIVSSNEIDDKVLFKSDGLPTYHMANVVDDYLMKISHVVRGEEWLPSAPLHVLLYKYLGWENEMPQFAHIPLILKPTGKGKLSKRDGDAGGFPVFPIEWKDPKSGEVFKGYRESGYFPEAVNNILALLGWNPGNDQELMSLNEMTELFSLERVGKSGAKFDPEKAKWFNHHYLQEKSNEQLADLFSQILDEKGVDAERKKVLKVIGLIKERASFVSELWDQSSYFFKAPDSYDEKVVKKRWKEQTPSIISEIKVILSKENDFTSAILENLIKAYLEKNELGFGAVMNPLRLCLVGSGTGAHLFDIMEIIGKDETLNRIQSGLENIKK
jgi:glutamyl-tRNA synthetase